MTNWKMNLKPFVSVAVVLFVAKCHSKGTIRAVLVCDSTTSTTCVKPFGMSQMYNDAFVSLTNGTNITMEALEYSSNPYDVINNLTQKQEEQNIDVLLAYGESVAVEAVSLLSHDLRIPMFRYGNSVNQACSLYADTCIPMVSTMYRIGQSMANVLTSSFIIKAIVIVQDNFRNDGLLEGLTSYHKSHGLRIVLSLKLVVRHSDSLDTLSYTIINIWKYQDLVVIFHCESELIEKILKILSDDDPDIWESKLLLFSPMIFQNRSHIPSRVPIGALALDVEKYDVHMFVNSSICAIEEHIQNCNVASSVFTNMDGSNKQTSRMQHICPELEDLRDDVCEPIHTYKLLSLQFDDTDGNCGQWKLIGTIRDNAIVLDTVVWPTGTILKNYNTVKKTLRVVTKLASPFVLASELLQDNLIDCGSETVCLQLPNTNREFVTTVTDAFLENPVHNKSLYIVHCCSGLAIDVLSQLSREFEFSFVLFFTNDSNFGTLVDGQMTGLLGDVMSGAADMIIGAFSITSERMKYISYSAAFYHSSFSMVSVVQERSTAISAFLDPFDPTVWVCLVCAATFTGSMISLLEWLSPYGLNPRGKKRNHHYTLGSGLTMVFSTLFGHTYRIKSPKSWPSKVLQITWSCLAIFTTANYTAKLAAFLAAQDQTLQIDSIYDKGLLSKKVSVLQSSAVDELIASINPDLHYMFQNTYVASMGDALKDIIARKTDVYVDDTPLLEHMVANEDSTCSLRYVGQPFGHDGYGIGLPKDSLYEAAFSAKIMLYLEDGYIDQLWRKYFAFDGCSGRQTPAQIDLQFGISHTLGLFVLLAVAILLSSIILIGERLFFKYVLPKIRAKPSNTFWKSETILFISQRLYRIIHFQLVSPRRVLFKGAVKTMRQMMTKSNTQYQVTCEETISTNNRGRLPSHGISSISNGVVCTMPNQLGKEFSGLDNVAYEPDELLNTVKGCENERRVKFDLNHEGKRGSFTSFPPDLFRTLVTPSLYDDVAHADLPEAESIRDRELELIKTYRQLLQFSEENDRAHNCTNNRSGLVDDIALGNDNSAISADMGANLEIKMKNNRYKSETREASINGFRSLLLSQSIDESVIEALDKEDLLMMWKASELHLYRKLGDLVRERNELSTIVETLSLPQRKEDV